LSGQTRAAAATLAPRNLNTAMSRVGWNIADQALSSLTNAALSVLIARSVDAHSFGAFAVCFTAYSLVIGVNRAFISDPLTVRFSDATRESFGAARGHALAAAVAVGAGASAILLVGAVTQSGDLRDALVVVALTMPGLTVQDALRLSFITEGRPRAAALNDFLWGALQIGGVGVLLLADVSSVAVFVFVWGAAAGVAALYGIVRTRALPAVRGTRRWVSQQLDLSGFFVAEYTAATGSFQAAFLLVGAIGEVADVGSLRGAQVLLGPLNVAFYGFTFFATPELVRRKALPRRTHVASAFALSGSLLTLTLVWGTLLLQLPDGAGRELLGDAWDGARSAVPAMTAWSAGIAATVGPVCVLRAFGAAREIFRLSLLLGVLLLSLGVIGATQGGADGAALGFAIAQWLVFPLAWARMLHVIGAKEETAPESPDAGSAVR
jgi:O-antigen/teichoic acid export membrane protein